MATRALLGIVTRTQQSWLSSLRGMRYVPIKWKLTLVILFVAIIISIAQHIFFTLYDQRVYLEYLHNKMYVLADVIGGNSVPAIKFNDRADALEVLSSLVAEHSIRSAFLFNGEGGVLAEYVRKGESLSVPLLPAQGELERLEEDSYTIKHGIFSGESRIGAIYITSDLEELAARTRARAHVTIVSGGVLVLIAFVLALWLQRLFTRPIRELVGATQRIAQEKVYSHRVKAVWRDEFGDLVQNFNQMLAEIERRDKDLERHVRMLEQSNKELDQFVYVASHDLKAPLRGVDNLAQMINRATKDILPPDKREYLDLMHQRIRRMEALFDDLLQYSRIGRIASTIVDVDTRKLVSEVVELLAPPPGFSVVIDERLPKIRTAKTPLEQVFRNLIGNSIKHHHRSDGHIWISAVDKERYVEFTVSDDGPGIPPQYHEKVFQMFQTLKPRDDVEGSGIGLALVKKIVENRGGRIRLESSGKGGAKFIFTWLKGKGGVDDL